jgi:hypothetical protein
MYVLFYDDGGQRKDGQVMTLKGYKSIKYTQKHKIYTKGGVVEISEERS